MINLIHTPPIYLSSTAKMHVESEKYHRYSFLISNTSYVLFLSTAQKLWAYQCIHFQLILFLMEEITIQTTLLSLEARKYLKSEH